MLTRLLNSCTIKGKSSSNAYNGSKYFMMRRNCKTIYKFLFISGITIICTVLIYRLLVKKPKNEVPFKDSFLRKSIFSPEDVSVFNFQILLLLWIIFQVLILDGEKIDWHDYKLIEDDAKRKGQNRKC